MSYNIFAKYGLDKIREDVNGDWSTADWELVRQKSVLDSDGFVTDYCWYTNGEKHIFMFGDSEIYTPDEQYADWECETEEEAAQWFNSYNGFADEFDSASDTFDEDDFDDTPSGNSSFMIEGLKRVYGLDGGARSLNESIPCRGKSLNE